MQEVTCLLGRQKSKVTHLPFSHPEQQGPGGQRKGPMLMPVPTAASCEGHTLQSGDVAGEHDGRDVICPSGSLKQMLPHKGMIQNPLDRVTWDTHPPEPASPCGGQHWLFHTQGPGHPQASFTGQPAAGGVFFLPCYLNVSLCPWLPPETSFSLTPLLLCLTFSRPFALSGAPLNLLPPSP